MKTQRGFALLAALWLLTALSIASLALAGAARMRRLAATNLAEGYRARAAAAAGIEYARAALARRLAESDRVDPWSGVDSLGTDTLVLANATLTVTVEDAGARLNINHATEQELQRLFEALHVDAGHADRLAQAIMDWRDRDDLHRARGAERDDYLAAGAISIPRNGPFVSVGELSGVRGMTADLFERAAPFLTVIGDGRVNLNAAPQEVLMSLPGLEQEAVAVLLRLRNQGRSVGSLSQLERELSPTSRARLVKNFPDLMARAITETREVVVTSVATLERSPVHARVTGLIVRTRGDAFYVWSRVE